MTTKTPINAQTPSPLTHGGGIIADQYGNEVAQCKSYGAGIVPRGYVCPWHVRDENAHLLAAAYTTFDRAGRALGIDAARLAESIDLTQLLLDAREALYVLQAIPDAETLATKRPHAEQVALSLAIQFKRILA